MSYFLKFSLITKNYRGIVTSLQRPCAASILAHRSRSSHRLHTLRKRRTSIRVSLQRISCSIHTAASHVAPWYLLYLFLKRKWTPRS